MTRLFSALIVLALTTISTPTISDSRPVFQLGNWQGERYYNENGSFTFCSIGSPYKSGIELDFVLYRDFNFAIGFFNDSWSLQEGEEFPLTFWIDRYQVRSGTGKALNSNLVFLDIEDTVQLFTELRKGYLLTVRAAGQDFQFSLRDTFRALERMRICVERGIAEGRSSTSSPITQTFGGTASPSQEADIERAEAVQFVANMLSEAGLTGFKILSPSDYPSEAFDKYQVVWSNGGTLGALQVLAPGLANTSSEVSDALTGIESRGCADGFVAARRNNFGEGQVQAVRLTIGCEAKDDAVVYYSVYPRDNGGYFIFAHLPQKSGDSQPQETDGEWREDKRSVSAEAAEEAIIQAIPVVLRY